MLLIPCPLCGPRHESEFTYGGPYGPRRPEDPASLPPEDWVAHLTIPDNPLGAVKELWCHSRGCGAWLVVTRDTRTHEILEVELAG